MDRVARRNGVAVLWAVSDWARQHGYTRREARRAARLAIMCGMDESGLKVLANPNVPESAALPHDGWGSDHASVGIFQQQVPGWGTAADCMDITRSTRKFLAALMDKGQLPPFAGPPLWVRVQAVQVSSTSDGSNYRRYAVSSWLFIVGRWNFTTRAPYGRRPA